MRFANPKAVLFLFLLIIVSVGLLWFTVSKIDRGSMSVKVKSIKNRSSDLVNYTIPYILSFFGFDLSDIADIISLSIFLAIMLIITIQTKAIFLNPVLAMMGYGLYDLNYSYNGREHFTVVLSKEELKHHDSCFIRHLTSSLYFVSSKVI